MPAPRLQVTSVTIGATLHECHPQQDVRVLTDPAGHPFCLIT